MIKPPPLKVTAESENLDILSFEECIHPVRRPGAKIFEKEPKEITRPR